MRGKPEYRLLIPTHLRSGADDTPYLDVAVHDAVIVQVLDAPCHLADDAPGVVFGEAVDLLNALEELTAVHAAHARAPPAHRPR